MPGEIPRIANVSGFVARFAALMVLAMAPLRAADETAPPHEQMLKIDVHSHVFEEIPGLNEFLRRINLRTINVCVPGGDGHIVEMHRIALDLYHKNPELYPFTATF